MNLWKFNRITGYWVAVRTVTPETKDQWLKIFRDDEPAEFFQVSKNRPSKSPFSGRKLTAPKRKRNSREFNRATKATGRWVITATKKSGGARLYYAGGARLTDAVKDAIKLPSMIHANNIKKAILADFPTKLTKAYLWQEWPLEQGH